MHRYDADLVVASVVLSEGMLCDAVASPQVLVVMWFCFCL